MKTKVLAVFTTVLLIAISLTPGIASAAVDYEAAMVFRDGGGSPISTALDVRISLWDTYDVRPGDIDGTGAINPSALHYGSYQTAFTINPDLNGHFVPGTAGYYKFRSTSLVDFPADIGTTNYYLQVEYKPQGDPDTSYIVYDFVNDPPFDNMERYNLLDRNISYITSDAGARTTYNTFTLDSNNNAATAVTLQFGETLLKTLTYSKTNNRFELNDSLVISGGLTASGTINFSTASVGIGTASPQSALHVADGNYAQFEDNNAGAPSAADCDSNAERGRLSIDTQNNRLYICNGEVRGWDYATLND